MQYAAETYDKTFVNVLLNKTYAPCKYIRVHIKEAVLSYFTYIYIYIYIYIHPMALQPKSGLDLLL
jgi:hypothetical protein